LSAALMNTARKDWMTLENLATEMPLTEDFGQVPLPAFGGQVRLLPQVRMKMKLADQTTAILPLTPSGTGGALVIKAPVILGALREYFEMCWEKATPLKPQQPGTITGRAADAGAAGRAGADGRRPARRRDRAAARLSTTTVRRHIAVIMARLGVSSRFAAGAAAQRRGWIG
jgi:hypothetical protein